MDSSRRLWRLFGLTALLLAACLLLTSSSLADQQEKGKGKGKGKDKGITGIVQVDLSKLPPDLAKQVLAALAGTPAPDKKGKKDDDEVKKDKKGDPKKKKAKDDDDDDEVRKGKKGDDKKGKGAAMTISLADAVRIAEKHTQGEAFKAQRKGEGTAAQYKVEVLDRQGAKGNVTLDARGQVLDYATKGGKDDPKGKGKGKGKKGDKEDDD
jgi:uncharacterized membrane protein YkoI